MSWSHVGKGVHFPRDTQALYLKELIETNKLARADPFPQWILAMGFASGDLVGLPLLPGATGFLGHLLADLTCQDGCGWPSSYSSLGKNIPES